MGQSSSLEMVFIFSAILIGTAITSPAQTFKTLVDFDGANGDSPQHMSLIQGTDGNLYGTTYEGGTYDQGTVFKVTVEGKLTSLYSFCAETNCPDGNLPQAGLVQGAGGNFYGTTTSGGIISDNCPAGCGTVFEITAAGELTTLHRFEGSDGSYPNGSLVQATNGNFYGTTREGGIKGDGTVFEITAAGKLTSLHSFDHTDGSQPYAGLMQATNGDFYGTTYHGGTNGDGTVFEITAGGKLRTMHNFGVVANDGAEPEFALIQATDGILYGTTPFGGANEACFAGCGTFFKITTEGTLTTLYSFCPQNICTDGGVPLNALVQASDANFYGTTSEGGSSTVSCGCGTVFKITIGGKLTTLYNFCLEGGCPDGDSPQAGLVQDTNGKFYGTSSGAGVTKDGTVFSLSVGLAPFAETQTTSGMESARIGILGQGFSGSSIVKFGRVQAATVTHTGTTFLTATVPAGALTGRVTVTTGSTTLTSSKTFRVIPQINSFTPTSGVVGASVKITGTELTQTAEVTFGGVKATAFTVVSESEVTADVPAGAKTGKIAITTPGGTATSAATFTVTP